MDNLLIYILVGVIGFLIGVVITRWIFGIEKIIDSLQKQNEYSWIQIRLLTKMLINQGSPLEEIKEIINKGNKKT